MNIFISHRSANTLLSALLFAGACLGQSTERASVSLSGSDPNGQCLDTAISANGRYLAFYTSADNLVPGDSNGETDVFVRDRQTGVTERVSVSTSGSEGNDSSFGASISADGRFVAFSSKADNLVTGDTNGATDTFVHDRLTGQTVRTSVDSSGVEADSKSQSASISGDGRRITFYSDARNLVAGDTNLQRDIFVHDLQTGSTVRASVSSLGVEGNGKSDNPCISGNGRYVAFNSRADNFVSGDTALEDIFVHDLQTGMTERVSESSLGIGANSTSQYASLSADGRHVAFQSSADNLVPGDTNGRSDIFVHDRQTGLTQRVNVSSAGAEANDESGYPSISADGRHVSFDSVSDNLVPGNTSAWSGVFVHDRHTGITERVSVSSLGVAGEGQNTGSTISADGRYVGFQSDGGNLVSNDTNGIADVFAHDRWSGLGQNSIYLTGPSIAPVGAPIDFMWQATRGDAQYWLMYSKNLNGAWISGHRFDLGYPVTIQARGLNATNGIGSHTSQPVPPRAAGHTLYFELAIRDLNGVAYDSNVVGVTFQ